jgi:deoxyribonuclease-4
MDFGFHVPIAGGLYRACTAARERRCRTLQLFPGSPRGWDARPRTDEEIAAFREARQAQGIRQVFIHAIYLLNLASSNDDLRERSIQSLCETMALAHAIGAEGVVTHLGSAGTGDVAEAIASLIASLRAVLRVAPPGVQLLLENSAGGGGCLGGPWEQLALILDGVNWDHRVGLCIDTCHTFAWGIDLRHESTRETWLDRLEALGLLQRVRLLHLNDSSGELGSRVDRHAGIGDGHIGRDGLAGIVRNARLAHLPAVLETPGRDAAADRRNLRRAQRLLRSDETVQSVAHPKSTA